MIILTFGTYLASESLFAQNTATSEELIEVSFNNGRLSVSAADDTLLVELMQIVGTKANFKVITFGNLENHTGSWSFSSMLLSEAIESILRGSSSVVSYSNDDSSGEQSVSAVYLLGVKSGEGENIRFNIVEPNLTNQKLNNSNPVDKAKSKAIHDRIEAIVRLEGISDEHTVTSLVYALQNDPDPNVRISAVTMLKQIGGTIAASALEKGLGDDNFLVRKQVVKVLGNIQDERILSWLGQVLMGDSNASVRLQALQAIAQKNNEIAWMYIKAAEKDPSRLVSETALRINK